MRLGEGRLCLADKGYQGIAKLHSNRITPQKNLPKQRLSDEDKQANRALARLWVKVEHSLHQLKHFRILSGRYRKCCRHFTHKVHLLTSILNFDLALAI